MYVNETLIKIPSFHTDDTNTSKNNRIDYVAIYSEVARTQSYFGTGC